MTREQHQQAQTICLIILAAVAFGAMLHFLAPVLIPFILALFLSIGLTPLVRLLHRRLKFPQPIAVIAAMIFGVLLLIVAGIIISSSAGDLTNNVDVYQARFSEMIENLSKNPWLEKMGVNGQKINDSVNQFLSNNIQGFLVGTASSVLGAVSQGVLVLIFMGFIMFGQSMTPAEGIWGDVQTSTQKYIITLIGTSAATGILVWLTLHFLGVEMAAAFGLLVFLLNFIPSIGSIIATILPLPVAILSPGATWVTVLLALAIPGVIQFTIGNVIQPKIMGKNFDLHPIVVLLMLIFWGMIWGIPGMFMATPITAVAKNLLARSEVTRPVADVLAGRFSRPADAPAEH